MLSLALDRLIRMRLTRAVDSDTFVVEVKGPAGVKQVEIPAGQVRIFTPEHGSEYLAALFLATCDLHYQLLTED